MSLVVVTGVSRGLGREMAIQFAGAGLTVCGCGRSSEDLETLSAQLGTAHDLQQVDVSSDLDVCQWAQSVISQHGVPDLLVNNAALINANAPLWEVESQEFDRLTSVNINGTANTIRHFTPAMVERKVGIIVNFSSGWGRSVSAGVAPYCASKWAIEGLTLALSEELPEGMAAVPLNPGVINTEMLQSCFGSGAEEYPKARQWAMIAVPFLLQLTESDNGRSLTVPAN